MSMGYDNRGGGGYMHGTGGDGGRERRKGRGDRRGGRQGMNQGQWNNGNVAAGGNSEGGAWEPASQGCGGGGGGVYHGPGWHSTGGEQISEYGTVMPASAIGGDEITSLLQQAYDSLEDGDVQACTKFLGKFQKVDGSNKHKKNPKLIEVLQRMQQGLQNQEFIATVAPKDLCDIAFTLGKLQLTNDTTVHTLLMTVADIAKYRVEQFTPHDMAGIVWGFASLGIRNEPLMSVVAAEVVNKQQGFDQRHLSNTAWAFAKCGLWNEQLVNAIANECLTKINTFTSQSLSHISWAMAQWGTRKDDLMEAIANEVHAKIHDFAPAPLAMTAWSFASLQVKNTTLMKVISEATTEKIKSFKTQDLAHLAWAFANLRIQDQQLFYVMAEEIQHNIKDTQPPELANIAWAFSKTNLMHEALMSVIATEASQQISNFKSAEVAMLTWAFAVAGQQNRSLMTEIGTQVARRIDKYSAQQLSHIAWAFGALSLKHTEFLQSLSTHVNWNVSSFKAGGLSNIAWAFAMVHYRDEPLLRLVAPEIARDCGELRPLALTRCAWAYNTLTVESSELLAAICAEALNKLDEFPLKALVKLMDSVYMTPLQQHMQLERALAIRIAEVANVLQTTWHSHRSLEEANSEVYSGEVQKIGFIDCGFVGTPMLLSKLGIGMPGRSFMLRCRKQVAEADGSSGAPKKGAGDVRRDMTALEYILKFGDQDRHGFTILETCQAAEVATAAGGEEHDPGRLFTAVDLPGRQGRGESTFRALVEVCRVAMTMGVDLLDSDDALKVSGKVELMCTIIPCTSSVGAMRQFTILFPGVTLEFVEQVGESTD